MSKSFDVQRATTQPVCSGMYFQTPEDLAAALSNVLCFHELAAELIAQEIFKQFVNTRCSCPSGDGSLRWPCPVHPPEVKPVSAAIRDVIAERQRQISAEGWTPEHDDGHENGELSLTASAYAMQAALAPWDEDIDYQDYPAPKGWPWDDRWWKPTNPRRDLVKAGALILAEIERLDRANSDKG